VIVHCRWILRRLIRPAGCCSWDSRDRGLQHPRDDAHRPGAGGDFRLRPRASRFPALAGSDDPQSTLGIALASGAAGSFLMMITRRKADLAGHRVPRDGKRPVLRGDERHLRHADGGRARHRARRAGGAMLVLGVFFFQIREQFDSLDLHHLESLKEDR
jgi:hypothetical protein